MVWLIEHFSMTEAKSGSSDVVSCDHMRKGLAAHSSEFERRDLPVGAPLLLPRGKNFGGGLRSVISFRPYLSQRGE